MRAQATLAGLVLACCSSARAINDSEITPFPRSGTVHGRLSSKPQVLCYEGGGQWTPARMLDMFAPVHLEITSSDPAASIKVTKASEDDLHHAVEEWVLGLLGAGSGHIDPAGLVGGEKRGSDIPLLNKLPTLDVLNECPAAWSSERYKCSMNVSSFGKTCVAVRSLSPRHNSAFTVKTTSEFRIELVTLVLGALLLLFMSGELAKSKTFQFSAGASLGVALGALLVVVVVFRRKMARRTSLVAGASLTYAAGVFAFLKSYLAQTIAAHWELVAAYVLGSAALGLFLTRVVRSDTEHKHRTRVISKWLVRLLGAFMIQRSTYSGATQAVFLAALVVWYVKYALQKNGFLGKTQQQKLQQDEAEEYGNGRGYTVRKYE